MKNLGVKTNILKQLFVCIISVVIVAVGTFSFCNKDVLNLPDDERIIEIPFNNPEIKEYKTEIDALKGDPDDEDGDGKKIIDVTEQILKLDNDKKHIKDIIVEYEHAADFTIKYDFDAANGFDVYEKVHVEDQCFNFLNRCGIHLNQRADDFTINIGADAKINRIYVDNNISFNWRIFVAFSIFIVSLALFIMNRKFFMKNLHILTFAIILSIGSILLSVEHNFTSTTLDDNTHYRLAATFAEGQTITEPTRALLYQDVTFHSLDLELERDDYTKLLNERAYIGTPLPNKKMDMIIRPNRWCYLIWGIPLRIFRTIKIDYMTSFFLAKVIYLLVFAFICALAVKIIPKRKILMMTVALLPQALFLATNYNYDPVVTSFTLLFFAALLREFHNKDQKLTLKSTLLILASGVFGALPKGVYGTLLFLVLLLPKTKFTSKRHELTIKIISAILVLATIFTLFIEPLLSSDGIGSALMSVGDTGASVAEQVTTSVSHPLGFLSLVWDNVVLLTPDRMFSPSTFGLYSYYGDMHVEFPYIIILAILFIGTFIEEKGDDEAKGKRWKLWCALCILGSVIGMLWMALYVGYTKVGATIIDGVQSRYFIPLLFPILFVLGKLVPVKVKIDTEKAPFILALCMFIINIFMIVSVIISNYII